MAPPPCINTEDLGCISPAKYRQERERIEQNHARQADFTNQWGLTAIRADRAYAHLELERGTGAAPGSGQTVGLIDTGIDTGHSMFAGKTVTEVILEGDGDAAGDETSHGTAVASVIVGDPSASYASSWNAPRGVARAADVAMFAVQVGSGDGPHVPVTSSQLSNADSTWASFINSAKNWNNGKIDFVNVSLAFRGIIEQYSASGLRSSLGSTIAALAQAGSTDKTVFVWAAGNAHGQQCLDSDFTDNPGLCVRGNQTAGKGTVNARSVSVLAGLPARIPELRGHLIAAVAVAPDSDDDCKPDSNNECEYEIADFSNRCGIAADWCIAAPGENVRMAYFGPCPPGQVCNKDSGVRGTGSASGTSFAAPMVVGGLVVLQDFFRDQMSNTELVSRLLSTANRSGIYSNSSIYGRGLMDLGAATVPVGSTNVTLGDSINDSGYALAQTRLIPGGALGNSLTRALGQHEIVAFDALGSPFWTPLDGLLSGERSGAGYSGYSLAQRMEDFMDMRGRPMVQEQNEWSLMPERTGTYWPAGTDARAGNGFLQPGWLQATSLASPGSPYGHLSLAEQALTLDSRAGAGLNVSAFTTEGMGHSAPASGAVMSWRPAWSQATPVNLKAGIVSERETLLGSHSSGAFGDVSEQAYFVGVGGGTMAGGWRLDAEAEIGTARPQVHGGLFDHISPLLTSAFSLSAQRILADGDVVSFSLSQPIRVERGHARLSVPVGRTKQGRVLHQSVTAELDAGGRQIDFYGQWRHFLPGGSELRFGAGLAQQPGHVRQARTERFWMAGWLHNF